MALPIPIAALLGVQSGLPQNAPAAAPDIAVTGSPLPPSKLHQGGGILESLFPHTFSVGSKAGNILGSLKDAFLVQAGRSPQYAPRLEQAREAEALENYSTDPIKAMQQLQMVNPEAGLKAFQNYNDDKRQQAIADATIANSEFNRQQKVRSVIGSMIYAANEQTLPAMVERAKQYAEANGIDPADLNLPTNLDEAKDWALGNVPVENQVTAENLKAYRDASIARQQAADAIREQYYKATIGERARHNKEQESIGRANASAHATSAAASKERADKYQPGGKKAAADPIAAALMKKYGLK